MRFNIKIFNRITAGACAVIMMVFSAVLVTEASTAPTEITRFFDTTLGIISRLVIIIISLAVVYFIWGLIKYGLAKSPEEKNTAKSVIIYGLIILFVMTSLWAIVAIITSTFIMSPHQGAADFSGASQDLNLLLNR